MPHWQLFDDVVDVKVAKVSSVAALELRAAHLRRGVWRIEDVDELGGQLQQAELLQAVGHGEGHAALVLLCGHAGCRRRWDAGVVAVARLLSRAARLFLFAGSRSDLQPGPLHAMATPRRDGLQGWPPTAQSPEPKNTLLVTLGQQPASSREPAFPCRTCRTLDASASALQRCALGRSQLTCRRVSSPVFVVPAPALFTCSCSCTRTRPTALNNTRLSCCCPRPWPHNTTPPPSSARYRRRTMPLALPLLS